MSKLLGTLRKKGKKGTYYYRVQIASGERREFSLKTSDPDEALQQAAAMDAVIDAPNKEVALAQINTMKGYSKKALNLPLSEIWAKYEVHPDRAMLNRNENTDVTCVSDGFQHFLWNILHLFVEIHELFVYSKG